VLEEFPQSSLAVVLGGTCIIAPGQIDVDDLRDHLARAGAGHRGGGPLLGHRRRVHLEFRPVDLQQHL
jgi:hypothetical protein